MHVSVFGGVYVCVRVVPKTSTIIPSNPNMTYLFIQLFIYLETVSMCISGLLELKL